MKILLHSLQYLPDAVGIGVYSGGLAEELAARGHAVEVVAAKPFYPQWKLRKGEPSGTYTRTENGVKVTRVPVYVPAEPSGARRIAHYLSFAATSRKPLKQADRPDLVISVAPALLAARVAGRVARQAGIPFWLHIQDLEVDAAMATGLLPHEGQVASAAFAVERRILEMPDVVSSISPRMLEKLAAKGVPAERLFELRNWSQSLDLFAHADGGRYRTEWNLGNRNVALYSGNIARKQGLELVIDAARRLQSRDDIVFVVCGEGPNRARLEEQARDLGNIQFHPLQPVERLGDLLTTADIHLLPQIAGAADLVLPSKLTNMLASGRPVVATAAPGTGLAMEVADCGIVTPPGDDTAFAQAIAALADDAARAREYGVNGQRRAADRWAKKAIIDRFEHKAMELVSR